MTFLLGLLVFLAAALYASVGHGGASAYLAFLTLTGAPRPVVSSTALILNVLVSGVALGAYARAGYFSLRVLLPFVVTSIPAAYLGGRIDVPPRLYDLLLAIALIAAAVRLSIRLGSPSATRPPVIPVALVSGAGIGVLSGIVGVGGGIFLSPLMILMHWAEPKQTAAVSAAFILLNSLAGLAGRFARGGVETGNLLPFAAAAFAGGLLGARLGVRRFTSPTLRRLLAVVLLVAAGKVLLAAF